MAKAWHASNALCLALGGLTFWAMLHWRESDNAAVGQAQARVSALQAQWRDAQPSVKPGLAEGVDPASLHQLLQTELNAAVQAKQVRDDVLQLLSMSGPGLGWQGIQLDRQGVWQLQLRADNQRALELWHQQTKRAGLGGLQWLQMARSASTSAGSKDAALVAHEPPFFLLTVRAPLGSLSPPLTATAAEGDAL